ncbi:hypothetical protein AcV5_000459 [Taiwanofungus camphoratus]|nr:hypothetical protein AcV5_000459 [Antrodia cinnamomea]
MAPRLNKRQVREQEELLALEAPKEDDAASEESEPDVSRVGKSTVTGFAALMIPAESDAENEEETTPRSSKLKKKKKKKKTAVSISPVALTPHTQEPSAQHREERPSPSAGPSKKERKTLKKQKAKENRDDMDEVDKALAELSMKYPDLQQAATSTNSSPAARNASRTLSSLLSVSLQHLDSEAEMRKFFGSKVISAAKSSTAGSSPSSRRTVATQRSNLTRPQPTWWPAQMREGLSVRLLSEEEIEHMHARHRWNPLHGDRIWTVEYSKKYRGATLAFMQTVMSGDPEGFWNLLRFLPYHADTLLQLSEVYYHREEHSTAADYIDRALFTYERAFIGSFNFTSGVNRLDFDRVENRPFFLALHRQVFDLQRRGCMRTAFEFARLLYSLDPWTDPHGALLHLDFLAIKADMGEWLLEIWDLFAEQGFNPDHYKCRMRVTVLPGWAYARALALYAREEAKGDKNHYKSTDALKRAILDFPSVVPLLADRADIPLSAAVRGHSAFKIHTDASLLGSEPEAVRHLLSHLYAQRSFSLWKNPARSSWFAQTVTSTLPTFGTVWAESTTFLLFSAILENPNIAYSVYRHLIVLESSCRRLFGFIPPAILNTKHLACDPLPPPMRVTAYDSDFFRGAEDAFAVGSRSKKATERMLERLIPDPVFRRQLQVCHNHLEPFVSLSQYTCLLLGIVIYILWIGIL